MPKTVSLHPLSLFVGAGFALLALVSMGQMTVTRAPAGSYPAVAPGEGIGNPHPRHMVQFLEDGSSSIVLNSGEEFEVFKVPSDRWCVLLTNVRDTRTGCGVLVGAAGAFLFQELAGGYELRAFGSNYVAGTTAAPVGGVVGWRFAPGSRIVIRALSPGTLSYNLTGYTTGI